MSTRAADALCGDIWSRRLFQKTELASPTARAPPHRNFSRFSSGCITRSSSARSSSAPPHLRRSTFASFVAAAEGRHTDVDLSRRHLFMLSAPALDISFDDDEWNPQPGLYRAASVGNSWGVTSIGRGFDWSNDPTEPRIHKENLDSDFDDPPPRRPYIGRGFFDWDENSTDSKATHKDSKLDASPLAFELQPELPPRRTTLDVVDIMRPVTNTTAVFPSSSITGEPYSYSPSQSRPPSPSYGLTPTISTRTPPPMSRSPTLPQRPRRRSSQQRVSLIAGRVSIATVEPSSPLMPPSLLRAGSSSSLLSLATSTRAPSPVPSEEEHQTFIGGRDISEFDIEGEIGRGAYGLVKRAREIRADRSHGVRRTFPLLSAYADSVGAAALDY